MKKLIESYHSIIFFVSCFFVFVYQNTFWQTIKTTLNLSSFFHISILFIALFLVLLYALILEILNCIFTYKFFLALLVIIGSLSAYYMDTFNISINPMIIESLFKTNLQETKDFISFWIILKIILLAIIPLSIIFLIKVKKSQSKTKFLLILFYSLSIIAIWFLDGKNIIFTFKAYKPTIDMLNPFAPIRSSIRYVSNMLQTPKSHTFLGLDATLEQNDKPKIFILVIGESARATNFELNGYKRPTNPFTKSLDLINFNDFYSCGVITAISIPCLLTDLTHQTYTSRNLSLFRDNLLDIAQRAKYDTWWISNNGGSCIGDVCKRIKNISYYNQNYFDGDMLKEIQELIQDAKANTFLVINLRGSHGSKYFERYPKEFEFFKPVCKEENLQKCTQEQLINAYDNSLRYSDFVISQIIYFLKKSHLDSGLWYVSDHGESLGEYGQFMHGGLPYDLAPKNQKHIPSYIWLNKNLKEKFFKNLKTQETKKLNHDVIFHTMLYFLNIKTKDYDNRLDIIGATH